MKPHIRYDSGAKQLILLDQRLLPLQEADAVCASCADVIRCIRDLAVRGAPAIGVAAAWGCVLAAAEAAGKRDWRECIHESLTALAQARPTAVNLSWAVERMRSAQKKANPQSAAELYALWLAEANALQAEDIAANEAMGKHGQTLLRDGDTVLTHCNAGALATAGYGSALGVIRAAVAAGKRIQVIAGETRPVLQGARLTAYELQKDGIPVTVACDNAAALLMRKGLAHKVLVGADRIAANGDTANKIGTYGLALLARAHGIPFYIAAPFSTVDMATPDGDAIPIEERGDAEVAVLGGTRIMPEGVQACNFAFDVTPAALISAIITEQGIFSPPFAFHRNMPPTG